MTGGGQHDYFFNNIYHVFLSGVPALMETKRRVAPEKQREKQSGGSRSRCRSSSGDGGHYKRREIKPVFFIACAQDPRGAAAGGDRQGAPRIYTPMHSALFKPQNSRFKRLSTRFGIKY